VEYDRITLHMDMCLVVLKEPNYT